MKDSTTIRCGPRSLAGSCFNNVLAVWQGLASTTCLQSGRVSLQQRACSLAGSYFNNVLAVKSFTTLPRRSMFLFSATHGPWLSERHRTRAKLDEICYTLVTWAMPSHCAGAVLHASSLPPFFFSFFFLNNERRFVQVFYHSNSLPLTNLSNLQIFIWALVVVIFSLVQYQSLYEGPDEESKQT